MGYLRLSQPRFLRKVLVVYWSLLFVLTHVPKVPRHFAPETGNLAEFAHKYGDKFAHFSGFFILTVLLACVMIQKSRRSLRWLSLVLLIVSLYGAIDELSQGLVRNRHPDLLDWLADLAGASVALTVFTLWVFPNAPPESANSATTAPRGTAASQEKHR